jgi:hypothetical protein
MLRVGGMSDDTVPFIWDEGQMIIPLKQVLANKEKFIDWTAGLLGPDHSANEVGGLQNMFFHLLAACTGQEYEDLASGSKIIRKAQSGVPNENNPGSK